MLEDIMLADEKNIAPAWRGCKTWSSLPILSLWMMSRHCGVLSLYHTTFHLPHLPRKMPATPLDCTSVVLLTLWYSAVWKGV